MSDDLSEFTPPVTPPSAEEESKIYTDGGSVEVRITEDSFLERCCSFRWFSCLGEAKQDLKVSGESYLLSGEAALFVFSDEIERVRWKMSARDRSEPVDLFGHRFDKGGALLTDAENVFKMARCEFMALDSVFMSASSPSSGMRGNASSLSSLHRKGVLDSRRRLVRFFLYVREYLLLVSNQTNRDSRLVFDRLSLSIGNYLNQFRRLMKKLTELPEYVCNYTANSQGNETSQCSYHVFHCHLDLRWLYLTTLLLMSEITISRKKVIVDGNIKGYEGTESNRIDALGPPIAFLRDPTKAVESAINFLISDIIRLALLRFEKLALKDISNYSAFNCTCVRELWILILLLTERRATENSDLQFWNIVNKQLIKVSPSSNSRPESGTRVLPDDEIYLCSNRMVFTGWFVKSLSCLFKYDNGQMKSNYNLLEKIMKEHLMTSSEDLESTLRAFIPLLQGLLLDLWEPQNDPVILLWEYYHKRLNSPFYIPGTTLEDIAVMNTSAAGLISQVEARLSGEKQRNSFQMFLQLFGTYLRRTEDNPKYWNQIKGRIYSKFPASRMSSLTENGIYNFVSLFLTIAIARNKIAETCKKLQEFLGCVNKKKEDSFCVKLIWQTHLAILLINAESGIDLTECSIPLMKSIDRLDISSSDDSTLLKMFVEVFCNIVDKIHTDLGSLRISVLIGGWICSYFRTRVSDMEKTRLSSTLLSIVRNLKSANRQLEPEELDIFETLWSVVKSYITTEVIGEQRIEANKSSSECCPLLHLSEICACLAVVSIRVSHAAIRFREMVNVFTCKEFISAKTLSRFVSCLIEYKPLAMALQGHDIFIMKSWIRCETLTFDRNLWNPELTELMQYTLLLKELKLSVSDRERIATSKEPLVEFFASLRGRYMAVTDLNEKGRMRDKVCRYFDGIGVWLQDAVKASADNVDRMKRIYSMVGEAVSNLSVVLYIRNQSPNHLQSFIELLLLPPTVRRPDHVLSPTVSAAISSTLHLYIEGLADLGLDSDKYIGRVVQELIIFYLPKCVPLPGESSVTKSFSLVRCFLSSSGGQKYERKAGVMNFILETIRCNFIKQRVRTPPPTCRQSLQFLRDVLSASGYNQAVLKSMLVSRVLDNICSLAIFCEERSPCRREATDLVLAVLDCNTVREENGSEIGREVERMFSRLCQEHLAFSSRQLFALFTVLCSTGPDLVYRFLPQLRIHVKEVETKRSVGYDRALRAELESLEKMLNYMTSSRS